jgi:hypothetical protein
MRWATDLFFTLYSFISDIFLSIQAFTFCIANGFHVILRQLLKVIDSDFLERGDWLGGISDASALLNILEETKRRHVLVPIDVLRNGLMTAKKDYRLDVVEVLLENMLNRTLSESH